MDLDYKKTRMTNRLTTVEINKKTQYNSDDEAEINNSNYDWDSHIVLRKKGKKMSVDVTNNEDDDKISKMEIEKINKEFEREELAFKKWQDVKNYTSENALHIFDRMNITQFMNEFLV